MGATGSSSRSSSSFNRFNRSCSLKYHQNKPQDPTSSLLSSVNRIDRSSRIKHCQNSPQAPSSSYRSSDSSSDSISRRCSSIVHSSDRMSVRASTCSIKKAPSGAASTSRLAAKSRAGGDDPSVSGMQKATGKKSSRLTRRSCSFPLFHIRSLHKRQLLTTNNKL